MDDKAFTKAVKDSISIAETIRKLGRAVVGSNYQWVKKHVTRLRVNTDHWKGQAHGSSPQLQKRELDEILTENSNVSRSLIRKRLIRGKVIPFVCSECNISEWRGKRLSLVLDHIDGVRNNHQIENLRWLCPNCNSQTPTFAGRNKRKIKGM